MDATELARHVRALVDTAPPLTAHQRLVLRALLAPLPRRVEPALSADHESTSMSKKVDLRGGIQ
ncbi:hypothetical protein ACQEVB_40760 [Pseudonocardia sp. CA-107938]|uniref:hypothetical protein n=1 Tax=Pseudonocardia sp. CA-107938 TaxID=3240021 RepID=UPI003D8F1310